MIAGTGEGGHGGAGQGGREQQVGDRPATGPPAARPAPRAPGRAAGSHASAGSRRRRPARPATTAAAPRSPAITTTALRPPAWPTTATSTTTPSAMARSRIRRAASRGMHDLRRWPRGSAAGPETGRAGDLCRPAIPTPRRSWHDAPMTDQEARYDRIAEAYAAHWSPVHRPSTLALLDEVEADVAAGARRVLDVGCGTGALAAEAVRRWRGVQLDGVDASAGMLEIAERERAALPASDRGRIRYRQAPADRLPYPDGAFDLALTSFVLQLVPSRHRALREIRRVLAADGRLALVTWLQGGEPLEADRVYDEALADAGFEPREPGGGSDDLASAEAAVAVLRRAGFGAATARAATLDAPVHARVVPRVHRRVRRRGPVRRARAGRARGPAGGRARAAAGAARGRAAARGADRVRGRAPDLTRRPVRAEISPRRRPRRLSEPRRPRRPRRPRPPRRSSPSSATATGSTSSTRGGRTRATTSDGSATIVTPSGAATSARVIVTS